MFLCYFRSKSLGGHWETEFLPKASRGQSDGYSFTAALHRSGETLSYGSTVSKCTVHKSSHFWNVQLLDMITQISMATNMELYTSMHSCTPLHTHTLVLLLCFVRLPNVTVLNGSVVTDGEREDAERFFIRYHLDCPEDELPQR